MSVARRTTKRARTMTSAAHAQLVAAALLLAFARVGTAGAGTPSTYNNHNNMLFYSKTASSHPTMHLKDEIAKHMELVQLQPVNERFPHAVLFQRTCGGTIISPTWILTAAHCTLFMSGRTVVAATNDTSNGTGLRARVKRLVIHPRYSVGPYWLDARKYDIHQVAARYDFLLAELETPLPLDGKTMVSARLDDRPALPPGLHVAYAGFGAAHHGDVMRPQMHAMELETEEDDVCARQLEQYDPQDMFCTRGRPPRFDSACNGDSGSGLVDGRGTLVGVASWVEGDARACFPGALVVFARVTAARPWIRRVTGL